MVPEQKSGEEQEPVYAVGIGEIKMHVYYS